MWWTDHRSSSNFGTSTITRQAAGTAFTVDTTGAPSSSASFSGSFAGGTDDNAPTDGEIQIAYNSFADPEVVDISLIIGAPTESSAGVINNYIIENICEVRRDCVCFISAPETNTVNNSSYPGKEVDDLVTHANTTITTRSSYAVMDGSYKYQYDKYNDVFRNIALAGDVAGLCARTDLLTDPWFSPAGYNRGSIKNVVKLHFDPSRTERDEMYRAGINPVVQDQGHGTVLFGDKTMLSRPSAFDRINVRRLFIVLEKAIATAAKFSLFEFNDEFTRSQFVNMVEPFLRDVQGRRGIIDFKVVADSSNNTGEVIDRNEFVADIFIKPARSINFITLNFIATRTGISFDEVA
jgi:phage tail sheath protein FI